MNEFSRTCMMAVNARRYLVDFCAIVEIACWPSVKLPWSAWFSLSKQRRIITVCPLFVSQGNVQPGFRISIHFTPLHSSRMATLVSLSMSHSDVCLYCRPAESNLISTPEFSECEENADDSFLLTSTHDRRSHFCCNEMAFLSFNLVEFFFSFEN